MDAKQFTHYELEKMLSDHIAFQLGRQEEISAQEGKALLQNTINIAKQLLSILNTGTRAGTDPDHVTAEELETMIAEHETFWSDRCGRGDVEAEKADVLPGRILQITSQLIETMKHKDQGDVSPTIKASSIKHVAFQILTIT